jgi:hypothetical protein
MTHDTQDQTVSGNTKVRVDELMSKTRAFNEKIEESVGQISESSEHVGAEVRRAATAAQGWCASVQTCDACCALDGSISWMKISACGNVFT